MPINISWKKMALGMKSTYTKKGQSTVCRDFSDGSKVCMSEKGWSVFFATINKMGAKDTKPRPKQTQESREALIQWFTESKLETTLNGVPRWVGIAEQLIGLPTTDQRIKNYWKNKLDIYYEENKENADRDAERRLAVKSVLGIIDEEVKKMEN